MGIAVKCENCGKETNSDEGLLNCPECNRPYKKVEAATIPSTAKPSKSTAKVDTATT